MQRWTAMSDDSYNSVIERFEAVCEGCGLNTIVGWDGEVGLCDLCRSKRSQGTDTERIEGDTT